MEKHHIPDRRRAGEHHHEAVDADADTTGWGHTVLEGFYEIVIDLLLLLAAGLVFEALALEVGVVKLGVTR